MTARSRMICILALVILTTGCASTSFESRVADGFDRTVERLFVLADVGGNWDQDDVDHLRAALRAGFVPCVEVEVAVVSPLSLDPGDVQRDIESFAPEFVLVLDQTMEKSQSMGIFGDTPRGFVFNAILTDPRSEEIVWRANLDSSGNSDSRSSYIGSMVEKLIAGMNSDGVVNCPQAGTIDRNRKPAREIG
ncbi:hypothetical protein GF314_09995 [bacterium]|nr:hypothetical protein [bacterium]